MEEEKPQITQESLAKETVVEVKEEIKVSEEKLSAPVQETQVPAVEEKKTEESLSVPVVEEKKEEKLSIDDLKEQLTVVKQTREELSRVYQDIERLTKESLELNTKNKELETSNGALKLEKESLSNQLIEVSGKLAKIEETEFVKRLEKLSADFKILGQEKTIEQLKLLDKAIISEFEEIVKAGISVKKTSEQLEAPTTAPSEVSEKLTISNVEPEKSSKPGNFFEGVCKKLTTEQGKDGVFQNKIVRSY